MTEDQLSKAEDLLRDPDSEDCERFASWYGADLIATVRRLQQPSRSEAQPSGYDGGLADLERDALRFRALMRCGRIKMQGSSGVDPKTGERNGNNVHFGAEFWPEKPRPEYAHLDGGPQSTAWGVACLTALADVILEQEAALTFTASLSDASPKPSSDEQET